MQFKHLRVCEILDFAALNHADTEVVSRLADGVVRHGYADIRRRARRAAHALTGLGLGRGDAVATLAWNHHRHLELYYAIPGFGGVIHTINPRVSPDQIAYMIDVAEDRALAFDSDFADLVKAVAARVARPLQLIELTAGPVTLPGALSYEALIEGASEDFDWVSGEETDRFGLCFTSGTTGEPKGVAYTHRSTVLHAMACCMAEAQAVSSRETILPVVPMFHANAWGLAHSAPMAGARLVLPGRQLDGASLLDLIKQERVTFLCGVPTVWQAILDTAEALGKSLEPLRRAGMGGSAPSEAMIERLEAGGADVFHAWGMTETNPSAGTGFLKAKHLVEPAAEQRKRKVGQGRPIFGLERRLVSEEGAPLPHDGAHAGRLQVRGNWVVDQYINAERTAVDSEGWFDTGDVATIDGDGYMQLVDRSKDLIKSGGEWISSIELENLALGVDGVAYAAALGKPDRKWGERPIMVVVRRPGHAVTEADILRAMSHKLMKWQVPDAVVFREGLPLTAVGKIDKKALRADLFA